MLQVENNLGDREMIPSVDSLGVIAARVKAMYNEFITNKIDPDAAPRPAFDTLDPSIKRGRKKANELIEEMKGLRKSQELADLREEVLSFLRILYSFEYPEGIEAMIMKELGPKAS